MSKKSYNIILSEQDDKCLSKIAKQLGLDKKYTQTRSKTIQYLIANYLDKNKKVKDKSELCQKIAIELKHALVLVENLDEQLYKDSE